MNPKILALVCALLIAILEGLALFKGINGTCLALTVAGIAGLGGYGVNEILHQIKNRK